MRGGIWWINFSFGRKPESLKAFVSGMIGDLGNHRGCRGGYGFLRKPIYIVRSAHGLLACISVVRDCTQAVTLQFRHEPVFPALREPVPPRGGHSVFPALRGKGRSAALYPEDLYFLYT